MRFPLPCLRLTVLHVWCTQRAQLSLVHSCLPNAVLISESDQAMHHHQAITYRRRHLLETTIVPEPIPSATPDHESATTPLASAGFDNSTGLQVQQLPSQAWNLARVSQRDLPLAAEYSWASGSAAPVSIYVVDRYFSLSSLVLDYLLPILIYYSTNTG